MADLPRRIVLPAQPLIDGPTALRPWRDSDLRGLVDACQDSEISRWTRVPANYTVADGRRYLQQRYDMAFAGLAAAFAIVRAPDGELLGSISLMRIAWEHQRAEVGYWLALDARGEGHTTRAVRLICEWGFRELRLARIALLAATGNGPSQRVAERSGFTHEALLRSYMRHNAERQDMLAYALLAGGS
jgi:RimJ/RimL family protein N-acetyltransferase